MIVSPFRHLPVTQIQSSLSNRVRVEPDFYYNYSRNLIRRLANSYVAVTPAFASKSRLNVEAGTQLPMKTVGGSAFADLAYATTVAVGKAEAQGVAVAVVRGDRLDGLLGMSFLARFKLNVSQSTIDFTALPLR